MSDNGMCYLTVDASFKVRVVAHAFRRIRTASGSFWRSIHPLFMTIVFMTSDPPRGRNNFSKFSDPQKCQNRFSALLTKWFFQQKSLCYDFCVSWRVVEGYQKNFSKILKFRILFRKNRSFSTSLWQPLADFAPVGILSSWPSKTLKAWKFAMTRSNFCTLVTFAGNQLPKKSQNFTT